MKQILQVSMYKKRRGSALVAVLWLIVILSFAALTAVKLLSFDMDVASSQVNGFKARQIAERGLAVAVNPSIKRDDPLLNFYDQSESLGYDVKIRSEGDRFNINYMLLASNDKRLLKEIFVKWGIEIDTAQEIADALKDWVDPGDERELNGAEKEWYQKRGRINQPFNRAFYSLDEMRLVKGMDLVETAQPNWREWFTVLSSGPLDVNEAEAEKIVIAAECNLFDAEALVKIVRGADGIRGTKDDNSFRLIVKDGNGAAPSTPPPTDLSNGESEEGQNSGGTGGEEVGQNTQAVFDVLRVPKGLQQFVSSRLTTNDSTTRIISTGISGDAKKQIILVVRNRTGKPAILEKKEEVIP
jgi:general secretion pathway protein K